MALKGSKVLKELEIPKALNRLEDVKYKNDSIENSETFPVHKLIVHNVATIFETTAVAWL
jgi:hypothetical protein